MGGGENGSKSRLSNQEVVGRQPAFPLFYVGTAKD